MNWKHWQHTYIPTLANMRVVERERYISDYQPTHTDKLNGVARMLADAPVNLKVRRLRGKVWISLDGTVFEVKVSHTA